MSEYNDRKRREENIMLLICLNPLRLLIMTTLQMTSQIFLILQLEGYSELAN